ncbi:MAG: hypothetical protein SFU56_15840 [Capsulimonadales bacterium]|nr:hypothetical protein [Capsulimonadales bacterium]
MAQVKRRYTTTDGRNDWIVTVSYDERGLSSAHWFEAGVAAVNERTGAKYPLAPEIATYRIGEVERPFRDFVRLDFDGDREAAIDHLLNTIYRRVYSYIERGH